MFSKKPKHDSDTISKGLMPRHVAIIMDGNGRWAHKRAMPRIFGHRQGAQSVRKIVRACGELGIKALTLYAFSTENWSRPQTEVSGLMNLLSNTLRSEVHELNENNVQLRAIGRLEQLPPQVQQELQNAIEKLAGNNGLILTLALNYGGRQEIIDAVNKALASGQTHLDEENFKQFLYTQGLPDPDLVIRTSGEQRISNFLLYQAAYAEFYTTPVPWPEFDKDALLSAIGEFQKRERRFGGAVEKFHSLPEE